MSAVNNNPISYTCGLRVKLSDDDKDALNSKQFNHKNLHCTGVRLGPEDSFDKEHVLSIFKDLKERFELEATVKGFQVWGRNIVMIVQFSSEILELLSQLDAYSKPERDDKTYFYVIENESKNKRRKTTHVSFGSPEFLTKEDLELLFPVGKKINFAYAFIKKEGNFDPEESNIVHF